MSVGIMTPEGMPSSSISLRTVSTPSDKFRVRRILVLPSILALLACSGAITTRITEVDGKWGGDNAGLIVDNTDVHVHIGCTLGNATGPIRPDTNGRFESSVQLL